MNDNAIANEWPVTFKETDDRGMCHIEVDSIHRRLALAVFQAMSCATAGTGLEPHGDPTTPFHKQSIVTEAVKLGPGACLYQIRKKALEAMRLDPQHARQELLDVIVYAAAECIAIDERRD